VFRYCMIEGKTIPPVAKLLSIFTKKVEPKGGFIPLSISASYTSPAIKYIEQSRDLYLVYQVATGYRKTFSLRPTRDLKSLSADQQLTNDWPTTDQWLTNIVSFLINSFGWNLGFGHISLLIYPSPTYLLILWNFTKYLYI